MPTRNIAVTIIEVEGNPINSSSFLYTSSDIAEVDIGDRKMEMKTLLLLLIKTSKENMA